MPEQLLKKDLHRKLIDIESEQEVRRLATRYRVSLQAMTIRLGCLGLVR